MSLPNFVFCFPHFIHLISGMASQSWFMSLGTLIPATCLLISGNVFLFFCSYCLSLSLAMTSGSSLGKQTITWACARVMICIALELFPFSLLPLQRGLTGKDREWERESGKDWWSDRASKKKWHKWAKPTAMATTTATGTGNWQPAPAHTCIISCSARYVAHSLFALNAVSFFAIMAISFLAF